MLFLNHGDDPFFIIAIFEQLALSGAACFQNFAAFID
jgi:hypothetical protein